MKFFGLVLLVSMSPYSHAEIVQKLGSKSFKTP